MEPLPRVFDMLQYFETIWEKQLGKELSHAIAHTARGDDNNDPHLFCLLSRLLSVNKFKSSLKFLKKTNGKRFIVCCWVMDALRRRLGRIAKRTKTRGIVYLTSSACSMGICSTLAGIWLVEFSSYVITVFNLLSATTVTHSLIFMLLRTWYKELFFLISRRLLFFLYLSISNNFLPKSSIRKLIKQIKEIKYLIEFL